MSNGDKAFDRMNAIIEEDNIDMSEDGEVSGWFPSGKFLGKNVPSGTKSIIDGLVFLAAGTSSAKAINTVGAEIQKKIHFLPEGSRKLLSAIKIKVKDTYNLAKLEGKIKINAFEEPIHIYQRLSHSGKQVAKSKYTRESLGLPRTIGTTPSSKKEVADFIERRAMESGNLPGRVVKPGEKALWDVKVPGETKGVPNIVDDVMQGKFKPKADVEWAKAREFKAVRDVAEGFKINKADAIVKAWDQEVIDIGKTAAKLAVPSMVERLQDE